MVYFSNLNLQEVLKNDLLEFLNSFETPTTGTFCQETSAIDLQNPGTLHMSRQIAGFRTRFPTGNDFIPNNVECCLIFSKSNSMNQLRT